MQYRGYEIVGVSWESTIWTLDENNEPDNLIWENPSEGITQFQVCVQVSTEPPRYEATDDFEYELFDTVEQTKERIDDYLDEQEAS